MPTKGTVLQQTFHIYYYVICFSQEKFVLYRIYFFGVIKAGQLVTLHCAALGKQIQYDLNSSGAPVKMLQSVLFRTKALGKFASF